MRRNWDQNSFLFHFVSILNNKNSVFFFPTWIIKKICQEGTRTKATGFPRVHSRLNRKDQKTKLFILQDQEESIFLHSCYFPEKIRTWRGRRKRGRWTSQGDHALEDDDEFDPWEWNQTEFSHCRLPRLIPNMWRLFSGRTFNTISLGWPVSLLRSTKPKRRSATFITSLNPSFR